MNQSKLSLFAMLFFLLLGVGLLFSPVHQYNFIQLDDPKHTTENPYLNPPTTKNLLEFWKRPYFGLYIPLTYTVWGAVTNMVSWFDPLGPAKFSAPAFHKLNLFLHLINILFIFLIIRSLIDLYPSKNKIPIQKNAAAFLGALFFAIHPVQVQTIGWISAMKDLLATLLAFLSLYSYIQYQKNTFSRWSPAFYLLACTAYAFALLAKPSIAILPFVLAILSRYFFGKSWRQAFQPIATWFLLILPLVLLTKQVQPDARLHFITPWLLRPIIALDALSFYLYKIVFPWQLSIDYGRNPQYVIQSGWIYISWFLPAFLAYGLYRTRNHFPWLCCIGLLFAAALLPVLGFIPFLFQIFSTVADHYLYFPLSFLALGAALLLAKTQNRGTWTTAVLLLGVLGLKTAQQIPTWKNGIHVFQQALRVNPESLLAHNNLGVELQVRGQHKKAAEHFKQAVTLNPKRADIKSNLGAALIANGQVREGLAYLHQAETSEDVNAILFYNLGRAYLRLGNFEKAKHYARIALQKNGGSARNRELIRAVRLALQTRK